MYRFIDKFFWLGNKEFYFINYNKTTTKTNLLLDYNIRKSQYCTHKEKYNK